MSHIYNYCKDNPTTTEMRIKLTLFTIQEWQIYCYLWCLPHSYKVNRLFGIGEYICINLHYPSDAFVSPQSVVVQIKEMQKPHIIIKLIRALPVGFLFPPKVNHTKKCNELINHSKAHPTLNTSSLSSSSTTHTRLFYHVTTFGGSTLL